jgi:hypothetical protein
MKGRKSVTHKRHKAKYYVMMIMSSKGVTVRVSGNISKYRNLALLNSKITDASIGIGVTDSNCNFARPNVIPHPLYTGQKEYYLAD